MLKKWSSWSWSNIIIKRIWPFLERPSTLSGVKDKDHDERTEIKFDDNKTNKNSYNLDKEGGNDEQSKEIYMLYNTDLIIHLERMSTCS